MTFSDLIDQIKIFEGFVDHTYTDVTGHKTIGYGFTASCYTSMLTMDKKTASTILEKEVKKTYSKVKNQCVEWGYVFTESQLFALTSFTYNCGQANLCLLTDNGRRTQSEIAQKILLYDKSKGKRLKGLTKRRKWEQSIFCGTYSAKDIQILCNDIIDMQELTIKKLVVDGIIGEKTVDCVGKILSLIR